MTFNLESQCLGIGDQLRPVRRVESGSLPKEASLEDDQLKLATLMEGYVSGTEDEEEDQNSARDFIAESAEVLQVKLVLDNLYIYIKCIYIYIRTHLYIYIYYLHYICAYIHMCPYL